MGINPNAHLMNNLYKAVKRSKTRDGYGKGLVKAGEKNNNVVVLCADLSESTRSEWFQKNSRNVLLKWAWQNRTWLHLLRGCPWQEKIVFMSSYAVFSPGRNNEQIRTTISYNSWGSKPGREINVKIGGAHAGISVGRTERRTKLWKMWL